MSPDRAFYGNREQSFIKHRFLTEYLKTAAIKTLQGPAYANTFNYVDAFAGPWEVQDDDCSDTSFHQAITTLEEVRTFLEERGRGAITVRFCLCERRPEAVAELERYATRYPKIHIRIFPGCFEDNLGRIAAAIPNGFTFTFIDPTGWNIRNADIFQFLAARRGEFLLNFMSDHINRHAGWEGVAPSVGRFLADSDWADEFNALPVEWGNEERVLHLLRSKMRQARVARLLPDFPINAPRENRRKMRLLLGTHSPDGLRVFRDVQRKVEREEMQIRLEVKDAGSRQARLLSDDYLLDLQQQNAGVGCMAHRQGAARHILRILQGRAWLAFDNLSLSVMEALPMRQPDVNEVTLDLRHRGNLAFDLPPGRRVPQPDTRIALPL